MKCAIGPVLLLAALAAGADVGVDTILAPGGTVDSGQVVTPRCVVVNYADSVSSVQVHFGVFDPGGLIYLDSLTITGPAAGARDTVALTAWEPECRDSLLVKAWTTCAGDTNPANDTFVKKFFVRVVDVAVVDIWPDDTTFDSGVVIHPRVRVWNCGNQTKNFGVHFRNPEGGVLSREVTLGAGASTVVAGDSWTAIPGDWFVAAATDPLVGDLHPENNYDTGRFYVRWTGVEESPTWSAPSHKLAATILGGASGVRRLASGVVYDATGRRVLAPKPGVYFLRDEGLRTKDGATVRVRKVILNK
jgi:hypothetical protein